MKTNYHRIITYIFVILYFLIFGAQSVFDYSSMFGEPPNIGLGQISLISLFFSGITVSLFLIISRIKFYHPFHQKAINVIKILNYIILDLMTFLWATFCILLLIVFGPDITSVHMIISLIITRFLLAILYSVAMNILLFAMSIKISFKDIKRVKSDEIQPDV